ncbi:MAG: hypothetical protein J0M18_15135 [Ignavibacteria bacterium]|nr:hypothetical protein [Ignavibacteria bacterium]
MTEIIIEEIDWKDPTFLMSKMPLYSQIEINKDNIFNCVTFLLSNQMNFDCYCIECKKERVFQKYGAHGRNQPAAGFEEYELFNIPKVFYMIEAHCSKQSEHMMSANFYFYGKYLIKTGEYPSIADLAFPELNQFVKVLTKEELSEFKKGVGLISHGAGIGAFVYLRRVIEKLIIEAKDIYSKSESSFDEIEFNKKDYKEKIEFLKDFLPDMLVSNKVIYSILSKGIHQLNEEECKKYFPVLKEAIETILEEKEHLRKKLDRKAKLETEINKIYAEESNK